MDQQNEQAIQPNSVVEPSVGNAYNTGWNRLWENFPILLAIWLIAFIIGFALEGILALMQSQGGIGENIFWSLVTIVISFLIISPVSMGMYFVYLRTVRDGDVRIADLFEAFNNYGNVLLTVILLTIIITFGFIMFIIPGIIFACKLAFTPYLVVDRKMGAWEAIQESWRLTRGYAWQIFLIYLLAIPITITGCILLVIGVIPAVIWIGLASAAFYSFVNPAVARQETEEFAPNNQ